MERARIAHRVNDMGPIQDNQSLSRAPRRFCPNAAAEEHRLLLLKKAQAPPPPLSFSRMLHPLTNGQISRSRAATMPTLDIAVRPEPLDRAPESVINRNNLPA